MHRGVRDRYAEPRYGKLSLETGVPADPGLERGGRGKPEGDRYRWIREDPLRFAP